MSSSYVGSLLTKRKHELVEIAEALDIADPEAKMTDLLKKIQTHLDSNETRLSRTPLFRGLYGRRYRHAADSDSGTPISEMKDLATMGRKSINKAIDKVQATIDAANIPLPESPLNVGRVQSAANDAMAMTITPAQNMSRDLTKVLRPYSNVLVEYSGQHKRRVESGVSMLQQYFSKPEHIVTTSIAVELLFLLCHVVQFYDHTIFFPPAGGESGTIASLLRGMFFWLPTSTLTFRLPEFRALGPSAPIWPVAAWWFFSTVLPPLALSTVITTLPQKTVHRSGHNTRSTSHQQSTQPDPLTFALFRFALLILPLTSAAPSNMVDSLELSGNLQGRALGGGLLAGLILADRLHA